MMSIFSQKSMSGQMTNSQLSNAGCRLKSQVSSNSIKEISVNLTGLCHLDVAGFPARPWPWKLRPDEVKRQRRETGLRNASCLKKDGEERNQLRPRLYERIA